MWFLIFIEGVKVKWQNFSRRLKKSCHSLKIPPSMRVQAMSAHSQSSFTPFTPTRKRQHVLSKIVCVYILGSFPSQFLNIVFVDSQDCGCSFAVSLVLFFFSDSIFGFVVAVTCHAWASKSWSISKQRVLSCQFWFSWSSVWGLYISQTGNKLISFSSWCRRRPFPFLLCTLLRLGLREDFKPFKQSSLNISRSFGSRWLSHHRIRARNWSWFWRAWWSSDCSHGETHLQKRWGIMMMMMMRMMIRLITIMTTRCDTCFSVEEQAAVWWVLSVM